MQTQECFGCKGIYLKRSDVKPYQQYGIARYGVAIPECMAAMSEVLVKESELYGYPQPAHRLIVDAVGLQHPPHREIQEKLGISSRFIDASIQSIWIHGLALYCFFEQEMLAGKVVLIMKKTLDAIGKAGHTFSELKSPYDLGRIKMLDINKMVMEKELTLKEYTQLAYKWAQSVWDAWENQHDAFSALYKDCASIK